MLTLNFSAIIEESGTTETQKNKHKKIVPRVIISLGILSVMYLVLSMFFVNHFCFGSEINCINVSGKTVEEVNEQITSDFQVYTLNLKEQGDKIEQIKADEFDLKYTPDGQVQELKDKQGFLGWLSIFLNTKDSKMKIEVSFNEELLKQRIDKLSCFQSKDIIEPKNPSFEYIDDGYEIVDEEEGNRVNKDILYEQVVNAILNGETTIDLKSVNCYVNPQYTSKSQKTIDTKDMLNKYVSAKIIYNFGDRKETIDGSIINNWLKVDENLEVTFDEKQVRNYIHMLSNTYSTIGKTREFRTTSGETIKVTGGDYGWMIDDKKEVQNLITAIEEGKTATKEPIYSQKAVSHDNSDIGNTYVEVDMSNQHLWFYKSGSLIVQGDIVTGNLSNKTATPAGIYKLKYKEKDAILKGQGYSAPVSFWMPFNGGIGIHDASWRSTFGGKIYKTNGSHGCVNAPFYLAKEVFNNIEEGTPIICYY